MTQPEEHLSAFLASLEVLDPDNQVRHARAVVVPLLEHLGYALARDTGSSTATSVFILAAEIEKRLTSVQYQIASDAPVQP